LASFLLLRLREARGKQQRQMRSSAAPQGNVKELAQEAVMSADFEGQLVVLLGG